MANIMYAKAKQAFISGGIDLTSVTVKFVIVDTTGGAANYTVDSVNHEFLSDVAAGARRGTSPALSSKTVTNGNFDAADITNAFSSLSGGAIEAMILFVDTGVEATSRLIAYFDTGGGLPFSPTGNNADLVFNASGIFSI